MALKNRNANTTGRFRATALCPNCGERCLIKGSRSASNLTREFQLQCQNMLCGWTGVATMEIVRTIKSPSIHAIQNTLPPEVDKEYFVANQS
ncbi:ogr/Delta-like zinc finger family protein [Neisseriaceae bacterium B1]